MDVGTGIAIAGLWVFVGMLAISPFVANKGLVLGLLLATGFTIALI